MDFILLIMVLTRNNKIRLVYLGIISILALIFTLIGHSGANFWLMLERMNYVYTVAKIFTALALIYFIYDFIVGDKSSRKILELVLTVLILSTVLYFLFN